MKKFKIKARGGLLITLLLIKTLWCIGNQTNSMAKQPKPGSLGSIWTGSNATNPAIVKAKADKAKADAAAAAYAKKAANDKAAAIAKAKKK